MQTFDDLTDRQVETAIATATTCFEMWQYTTFAERAAVAARAAKMMRDRADDSARTVTLEMGKRVE